MMLNFVNENKNSKKDFGSPCPDWNTQIMSSREDIDIIRSEDLNFPEQINGHGNIDQKFDFCEFENLFDDKWQYSNKDESKKSVKRQKKTLKLNY